MVEVLRINYEESVRVHEENGALHTDIGLQ